MRFLISLLLLVAAKQGASADVTAMRISGAADETRIVIEAGSPVDHADFVISQIGEYAVLVDIPGSSSGPAKVWHASETGVARYDWSQSRLRLELEGPMMIAQRLNLPPTGDAANHRLVLDLVAVSAARFRERARLDLPRLTRRLAEGPPALAAARAPPPPSLKPAALERDEAAPPAARRAPRSLTAAAPARLQEAVYTIVIDPGHGGKDPGTQSASGVFERTVNLQAGLTLKALLEAEARYDVRLTRDDDRFLELEERVALAREWGADLFISIHADAARSPEISGASVYTLSRQGRRRSSRVAEDHDWNIPVEAFSASEDVQEILGDLVVSETSNNSGVFAALLIPELEKAGPVVRNTLRNGDLFVLLAPDVPAVLLEMGFLSNPVDARRIASERGRRASMTAVKRAIDLYFDQQDLVYVRN